jgi:hypothetical protein
MGEVRNVLRMSVGRELIFGKSRDLESVVRVFFWISVT